MTSHLWKRWLIGAMAWKAILTCSERQRCLCRGDSIFPILMIPALRRLSRIKPHRPLSKKHLAGREWMMLEGRALSQHSLILDRFSARLTSAS
jgi:hypothetical protein